MRGLTFGHKPASEIARELERTESAIRSKAVKLQVKSTPSSLRGTDRRWTTDETEYLKNAYGLIPTSAIARELARTEFSIRKQARKLNLKGSRLREHEEYEPWTQQDDEIIRNEFVTTPIKLLSDRLDRTESSIYTRAYKIGVSATKTSQRKATERDA